MKATLKKIGIFVLCAVLILSAFALPVKLSSVTEPANTEANSKETAERIDSIKATEELPSQQDEAYRTFLEKASALYRQYDADVEQQIDVETEGLNEDNCFILKRLMVTGFNGNTYGACDYAYDGEHDFALLQFETEAETEAAMKAMLADGLLAEPDTIALFDTTSPCSFDTVASSQLGLPSFFNHYQIAPDDVIVAVLDTGVMYDHRAIADRFYSHGVDLSGDGAADAYYDTEQKQEKYSHGTFISGIVADNTPDTVKIQPYKVVGFEASFAPSSLIVTGVNTAVSDGVSVINLSLHTNGGAANIERAVKNAINKKVCVCAAAGNSSQECDGLYPACTPGVITVSATANNEIAYFSNYGDVIDFAAPGSSVRSTYADDTGVLMRRWSGTSFSTPYIAAMCADVKSMNREVTKDEVYGILKDFAVDYGTSGYDIYFGNGVPNFSAIQYTGDNYAYELPQGTLSITGTVDYTADTQPWRLFAHKLLNVSVADSVSAIGNYNFYNMAAATFTLPQNLKSVGDYAFYNCDGLTEYAFDVNVERIGTKAFNEIDGLSLSGYRNTPAEVYAVSESIPFTVLGCKHNYIFEVFDPTETEEGYTEYTCTVCGDTYRGEYIPPVVIEEGQCGETLTYVLYDNGKLVIDGTGEMYNYFEKEAPWYNLRDQIQVLEIRTQVASVDPFAFDGCEKLSKIRCYASNEVMYADAAGTSLIERHTNRLILAAGTGKYTIPEDVTTASAPAFITLKEVAIEPNSQFTLNNGILYDKAGNLVCALPSYTADTLTLLSNITIQQYAFMYTQYPLHVDTNLLRVVFEPLSVGYYYDGTMKKTNVSFKAYEESTAYQYADENGFEVNGDNIGKCGTDITWRYDEASQALTLTGTGDMFTYASAAEVPWSAYLPTLKTVVIGDTIASISEHAFSGAKKLTSLTMPLSLPAPHSSDTWSGCTAIKTLTLTLGTGVMDDYVDANEPKLYTFTPWYLSRNAITSFSLNPEVKYIGREAFRNCLAIKELTLDGIEGIAPDAFVNCSKLKNVTITSKACELGDHCFFFMKSSNTYTMYNLCTIYAYDDSGAHDYAVTFGSQYSSLGCGHSRYYSETDAGTDADGRRVITCHCDDCGYTETFTVAHNVTVTVLTNTGVPLDNTEILIDGERFGVTDENGAVSSYIRYGGEYEITVSRYDTELFSDTLYVDGEYVTCEIRLRYADFVKDGTINAKDYAYALKRGHNEAELFDYGRIAAEDNTIRTLNLNRVNKSENTDIG